MPSYRNIVGRKDRNPDGRAENFRILMRSDS